MKPWHIGPELNVIPFVSLVSYRTLKLKDPDQKTLSQLMGDYRGVEFGAGIAVVGGIKAFLKNENDIKMRISAISVFQIFRAESIEVELKPLLSVQQS